jgi:hypothetical protein
MSIIDKSISLTITNATDASLIANLEQISKGDLSADYEDLIEPIRDAILQEMGRRVSRYRGAANLLEAIAKAATK